jgi:hypothetical protein
VKDRVLCEIGVGVASSFPYKPEYEAKCIIKKFFSKGAHEKAVEYLSSSDYRCQFVTSPFRDSWDKLLEESLQRLGAKLVKVTYSGADEAKIEVAYTPKDGGLEIGFDDKDPRVIEIVPFPAIIKELKKEFEERNLLTKDFADPIMRSIQWLCFKK